MIAQEILNSIPMVIKLKVVIIATNPSDFLKSIVFIMIGSILARLGHLDSLVDYHLDQILLK